MTSKLKEWKAVGSVVAAPNTALDQGATSPGSRENVQSALKSDIVASIKTEFSAIIRSEMKAALADDLDFMKCELQAVRTEVINNFSSSRSKCVTAKVTLFRVNLSALFFARNVPVVQLLLMSGCLSGGCSLVNANQWGICPSAQLFVSRTLMRLDSRVSALLRIVKPLIRVPHHEGEALLNHSDRPHESHFLSGFSPATSQK